MDVVLLEVMAGKRCLRFATAAIDHPTLPGPCEERLLEASWLDRTLFRHAAPFGELGGARGCMVLGNLDGHLDGVAEAEGRPVRLLAGRAGTAYGAFVPLFTGIVEQALVGRDEVTLVLCDRLALLDDAPLEAESGAVGELWRGCLGQAAAAADDHCAWLAYMPEATPAARLRRLAEAAGAWIGCDAGGVCRLRPVLPPETVAPALTLPAVLEPLLSGANVHGLPVHHVSAGAAEWADPTVKRRNPLARRLTLDTGLARADQAAALAARLGALFGPARRRWRASLALTAETATLDLGAVVAVGERRLLVTGQYLAPLSRRLEVTLWG